MQYDCKDVVDLFLIRHTLEHYTILVFGQYVCG